MRNILSKYENKMKNSIFFSVCLMVFSIYGFSQNYTLKLSQVLMLQTSATLGGTVTYTVPANKVWKIEGIMIGREAIQCSTSGDVIWYINQINGTYSGPLTYVYSLYGMSGFNTEQPRPQWMGAGNSITIRTYNNSCVGIVPVNWITVLEFDLVP